MRRGKDLQGYLLIRATDVFACTSIISVTYKRRTCIFFLNIFLFLLQRILFLTSHRRSLRNLKQNSEKLKIPFPLVSRKRKKKKKEIGATVPPNVSKIPAKGEQTEIPRNRTKVYTTCHHSHRFRGHHQYPPVQNILSPLIDPHVRTSRYHEISPLSLGNPLRSPDSNYIPTSHTHSVHDYARDRRESNDDTIPIGSKQRSIAEPRYDTLHYRVNLGWELA